MNDEQRTKRNALLPAYWLWTVALLGMIKGAFDPCGEDRVGVVHYDPSWGLAIPVSDLRPSGERLRPAGHTARHSPDQWLEFVASLALFLPMVIVFASAGRFPKRRLLHAGSLTVVALLPPLSWPLIVTAATFAMHQLAEDRGRLRFGKWIEAPVLTALTLHAMWTSLEGPYFIYAVTVGSCAVRDWIALASGAPAEPSTAGADPAIDDSAPHVE